MAATLASTMRGVDRRLLRGGWRHLFTVTLTAHDYAANLSTQSGVKEFPPDAQAELIGRIRRRILAGGGTVTASLLATAEVGESPPVGGSPRIDRTVGGPGHRS